MAANSLTLGQCPKCGKRFSFGHSEIFCPKCRFPTKYIENRFRLEAHIATGGFAVIYRGVDMLHKEACAIKLIRTELIRKETTQKRFQREIRATQALSNHTPHTVRLIAHGQDEDYGPFMVMEYLEGETLEVRLRKGSLNPSEIVHIFHQLCHAVETAHNEGIVHRDLKPENVMLLPRDQGAPFVKVLDFGIAKDLENATSTGLTKGVIGTPRYLAPEQYEGKEISPQTDIYSMGIMLYEMLTGQIPFSGDTALAVITGHLLADPPDLKDARPDLPFPEALNQGVLRALQKPPDERYGSVSDFWDAVADAISPGTKLSLELPGEWVSGTLRMPGFRMPMPGSMAEDDLDSFDLDSLFQTAEPVVLEEERGTFHDTRETDEDRRTSPDEDFKEELDLTPLAHPGLIAEALAHQRAQRVLVEADTAYFQPEEADKGQGSSVKVVATPGQKSGPAHTIAPDLSEQLGERTELHAAGLSASLWASLNKQDELPPAPPLPDEDEPTVEVSGDWEPEE